MKFKRLADLDLKGKKVFIRSDFNVPLDDNRNITDDTRIRASLASVRYCLDNGAAVILMSHLGRPTEGEFKPEDDLAPVAAHLGSLLGLTVPVSSDWRQTPPRPQPGPKRPPRARRRHKPPQPLKPSGKSLNKQTRLRPPSVRAASSIRP